MQTIQSSQSKIGMRGGILKLKMGLGKTIISICHGLVSKGPCLVITSKTLVDEWRTQGFEKFFGNSVKVFYFHKDYVGVSGMNKFVKEYQSNFKFIVTTYDVLAQGFKEPIQRDIEVKKGKRIEYIRERTKQGFDRVLPVSGPAALYYIRWGNVYADESQLFANFNTSTYKHVMGLYSGHKWCLTGTPVMNYSTDLWSQLRFCGYTGCITDKKWKSSAQLLMSRDHITNYIIELDYEDTHIELPDIKEQCVNVPLTRMEKRAHDLLKKWILQQDEMVSTNRNTLALFTKMRQCVINPHIAYKKREQVCMKWVVDDLETDKELKEWLDDEMKSGRSGSKVNALIDIIRSNKGKKVAIFSMFTSLFPTIKREIKRQIPSLKVQTLTGSDNISSRREKIDSMKDDCDILLIGYRVGSVGINLTAVTVVVCLEEWWTKKVHDQAISRCWRYGQTKQVDVYHIVMKGSIEEHCVNIWKRKVVLENELFEKVTLTMKDVVKMMS